MDDSGDWPSDGLRTREVAADPALDRLVRLAAGRFAAAVAVVVLVDADRQWLKAGVGVGPGAFSAAGSIAAASAMSCAMIGVDDTACDSRFASDALAMQTSARFCAAAPIYGAGGGSIGALVIMDPTPRPVSPMDLSDLETLAGLVGDGLERRRRQLSDEMTEAPYRALVELALSAIIVIDETGTVRAANPATEQLFGVTATDILGRNVRSLMPEPHRSGHQGYIERYLATGERRILGAGREVEGLRAEGSTFPMNLRIVEWRNPAGVRFFTGVARDLSKEKAAERALVEARNAATQARERLEDAIDALPEGFGLFDAEDCLIAVNARVRALYSGISSELLEGARYEDLLRATVERGMFKLPPGIDLGTWIQERLAYHRNPEGVEEIELANGRWVRFQECGTRDGGRVGLRIDITEVKRREEELRLSMEAAEAASRAKTQFLATMSHELRTPLNAVIGFSQLLLSGIAGEMPDSASGYVALIAKSGEHLIEIIDEVLDLARIETGELSLKRRRVDVALLLATIVEEAREQAENSGIGLTLEHVEAIPEMHADPIRLKQIVAELVANGIKFTPNGGVRVSAILDEDAGQISILVSDTGIGMRREDIATALAPFAQVDAGLDRRFEGCGLGLSLAARLTALHGGELTIDSVPDVGTRVQVRLPLGAPGAWLDDATVTN